MAIIDIRSTETEVITNIVFADEYSTRENYQQTYIAQKLSYGTFVYIEDCNDSSVRIESKEHALNLVKALNKAIELGWLK